MGGHGRRSCPGRVPRVGGLAYRVWGLEVMGVTRSPKPWTLDFDPRNVPFIFFDKVLELCRGYDPDLSGVLYGSDAPRVVSGTNFRPGVREPDGRQFRTTPGAFQTHTWCISGAVLMV